MPKVVTTIILPPPPPPTPTPAPPTPTGPNIPLTTASVSSTPPSSSSIVTSSSSTLSSVSTTAISSSSALPIPTTTSSPTNVQTSTAAGGVVVTVTSIIATTPLPSPTPIASGSADSAPRSFFHNTAAVAGVFTVAGLIAVAIFFICVINSIRRHRAQQFDRYVAEAAAAAANTKAPIFDDDVYSNGLAGYSDNSHGTYAQQPMNPESYGMTDMHPYDAFAASSGAAGVGVGAAVQRARSRKEMADSMPGVPLYDNGGMAPGLAERPSPYPAYTGPGSQHMYDAPHGGHFASSGNPSADLLEAAGIGAAASHVAHGPPFYAPPGGYSDPARPPSRGTRNLYGPQEQAPNESYAAHYQPGYQGQHASGAAADTGGGDDAYGGYIDPTQQTTGGELPNPHSPSPESGDSDREDENEHARYDDSRASFRDEEDYGLERGKRVLKVANE